MNRFGLKKNVLDFIVASARKHNMTNVVLFGSRAKGTYSAKSDIDLAVEGENVLHFQADLEENSPTLLAFDIIDCGQELSEPLKERIVKEGAVLYA